MPIKPEEFYTAAQALNQSKPPLVSDEVCARTMAGRMYYAAYLATRDAIRATTGTRDFDVSHSALVNALIRARDGDVQALGARLQSLRTLRERADYKPHLSLTRAGTAVRLADARFILDNVDRLAWRFPRIPQR